MKFIFIQIKLLIIFLLLLSTINAQTTFSTQSIITCKEYLWPINGNTYTSSGTYSDTIPSSTKFDSIITLNLIIKKPTFRYDTVKSCESYKWSINNITYYKSGIYFDTLVNMNGCDSIVSLNLSINYIVITSQKIVACNEYIWPVNNQKYTQTGEYKSVYKTIYGCDSIIFLRLIINHTTKPLPIAKINSDGLIKICEGDKINLQAYKEDNYEWYKNNQIIVGATQSVYKASTTGLYSVKVANDECSTVSDIVTVLVNQYPSSGVSVSGNTTFCDGNSVTLTAQGSGTYLWSNGATSKSITIRQAGNYNVAITSNGCVSNSNLTTIIVNPNPTATITPQGNTTFCQGGFVNLVASGGSSYQWNTGSSAATFSVTQSGTYMVNVFNSFGCQATASQQVTVNPLPNVILNALNQFTVKNASPIQLVANPTGGTFSGEGVQGSTFNPANVTLGKKTITYNYISPQGCSGVASRSTIIADTLGNVCSTYDTLKVKFKLTTGIKANQYTSMNVYPNPTSDVIIIDASDVAALNNYSYKLFDVQGKEVYNAMAKNVKTEISLKTIGKAGLYILHFVDANNVSVETRQIVLE